MVQNSRFNETDKKKIVVIGVGDCGRNIVNSMAEENVGKADYLMIDTDQNALDRCKTIDNLLIGNDFLCGNSANGVPDKGQKAAEKDLDNISDALSGYDMAVIVCGMGGGTGTGASPVIAQIASGLGILSIGVVAMPFTFEGRVKTGNAAFGVQNLKDYAVDVIEFSNDAVLRLVNKETTVEDTFKKANGFIKQAVEDIIDIANMPTFSMPKKTSSVD